MRSGCRASARALACGLALAGCQRPDDLIARLNATGGAGIAPGGGTASIGGAPPLQMACSLPEPANPALARYDFEDAPGSSSLHDSGGRQDAQVMGGAFAPVPGPEGCGQAFAFDSDGLFATIPDQPSWDLETGSIDFWFRVPDTVDAELGILSRDQLGTELPGHLAFWLTAERTLTARLQGATLHATHCTEEALAFGQWVHVGFNFGAPGSELWVAGKLAQRAGDPGVETVVPECGGVTPDGLSGNDQPWVLGFDTSRSSARLEGLLLHFDGGALDALQISDVRRDFQSP